MAEDEEFQTQDSGASDSYPIEAGQIRKGGLIMIKGRPCKVSDVTSSKTGKHGHAKCHFVAIDIFTGKKVEDLVPASHTTYAPFMKKTEYQCMDEDDDGYLTLMDSDGGTREDLHIPDKMKADKQAPDASKLSESIRGMLKDEKDFYVIVQAACGTEQIMDTKVMTG
jgi:translation initiation factor 5A